MCPNPAQIFIVLTARRIFHNLVARRIPRPHSEFFHSPLSQCVESRASRAPLKISCTMVGMTFDTHVYSGPEPAFPCDPAVILPDKSVSWKDPVCNGMTLRDYFAGQALAGDLATDSLHRAYLNGVGDEENMGLLAKTMYDIADAMMGAR